MKKKLSTILVCPLCKGPLQQISRTKELICEKDGLAFPIRNGVPILLLVDARNIKD